ncbi:ABC-F family ATP-binding cassette domain-containing protein [Streptomyces sp. H27-D2]|uniref:ABC-F family ATP-binding cassette domain-containing protein n=1 Tax=Streptomyces sp. H27-D2 TaxID=3046304 RepID=UPI002DBCCAAE|nr:ABC-F family ATP-binding cassette domain-containing protein [Streptomyces sp. H27-D2]MEC4015861.1 ABC-F family ATP-binding cassette domain-containing protein [Streptomyces sp. H27-D2]
MSATVFGGFPIPTQITLRGVSKGFGDRLLLDDVSFSARPGERLGIVGENGAGKSTMLRLLAGAIRPDDGEVSVLADGGSGYLGQTPELPPDRTVQEAVDAALVELRTMERRLRELERNLGAAGPRELADYGDLLTVFEMRGGYEADARVDKALHALGLAHIERSRPLGSLSGGEQARLGLACLMAAAPEVLLLDEPTNHLDDVALDWLEDALRAHPGTVVAVSHDRVFLERVTTAILEVDGDRRAVKRYGGGYPGFVAAKTVARSRWEQRYAQWCEEIDRLALAASTVAHQVAPDRGIKDGNKLAYDRAKGRVQSSISSRVRNAQERLRRLRDEPVPRPPDPLRFTGAAWQAAPVKVPAQALPAQAGDGADVFVSDQRAGAGAGVDPGVGAGGAADRVADPAEAGRTLVELDGIRVAGRLRVDGLTVGTGERLLIQGANGAGKSTLLRVMAGVLEPDSGTVTRRGRIGYLAQEIPLSRPAERLLSAFGRGLSGSPEEQAELLLSYGLFRERDLHVAVGSLSAGQRRRLGLARLLARPADLLLFDEPTNHLALDLVEDLDQALAAWHGALVVVSHDRLLRHRFEGRRYEMREGRLTA